MYQSDRNIKQNLRASSVEIYKRETPIISDDRKIYARDLDNLYPLRIEGIINNSPTARRCANMMSKFIAGNGVADDVVVNGRGQTINDIISSSADSIAYQYGVYFLVKYEVDAENISEELNFKISSIEILDYTTMAKSKEDDDNNSGKFYQLKLEEKGNKFKKVNDKTRWFYPFNNNSRVVKEQMRKDCRAKGIKNPTILQLLKHHRGQVYYLNLTPSYIYALPLVDSVYNDCDTEYRMGVYNNKQTRSGFLGKTIIVKYKDDEVSNNERPNHADTDSFNEEIKDSLGVEGSSDVLVIDVLNTATDDLSKAFLVNQVKAQFDDKLFVNLENSVKKRIMGAFNNIPEALVSGGDGALFGTNADTYEQMKLFYWEQNERERTKLERTLKLFGFDVKIDYFKKRENSKDEL